GRKHMMANFVGKDFNAVVFQTQMPNRFQVDHHPLIGKPDHGKTAPQAFRCRHDLALTKVRGLQSGVATPDLQGARPGLLPLCDQFRHGQTHRSANTLIRWEYAEATSAVWRFDTTCSPSAGKPTARQALPTINSSP